MSREPGALLADELACLETLLFRRDFPALLGVHSGPLGEDHVVARDSSFIVGALLSCVRRRPLHTDLRKHPAHLRHPACRHENVGPINGTRGSKRAAAFSRGNNCSSGEKRLKTHLSVSRMKAM